MSTSALLSLSRQLHGTTGLADVLEVVNQSVRQHTRYRASWASLLTADGLHLDTVGYVFPDHDAVILRMATLDVSKDRLLQRLFTDTEPFVIPDLRLSPDADQDQVRHFGNRTLIVVPLLRLGERLGSLNVGTFADEGVIEPTAQELAFIVQIGSLITLVVGRIRAEANEQALLARARATQRMESMGRLAGEISHDFNNLLVAIMGNAELAAGMLEGHPAMELVEEVQQASHRAAALTRQLLAFSRGQLWSPRILDLNDVIGSFIRILERLLPRGVSLSFDPGADLSTIRADRSQLEQLIMNLVINARDAMPAGGAITVNTTQVTLDQSHVAGRPDVQPGTYVRLVVSDTGGGIDPAVLDQIFEPFYSTKSDGEGTGLGLSVVRSVTQQHQGFATVQSTLGQGSAFEIYLPVSPESPEPPVPSPTPTSAAQRNQERVLVVDDDAQIRTLLERVLTDEGYRPILAKDGDEALELMGGATHIDLLLTDLLMPNMSGSTLIEHLEERGDPTPVILMSGYVRHDSAPRAFENVITKPFRPQHLLEMVRSVLDGAVDPAPTAEAADER